GDGPRTVFVRHPESFFRKGLYQDNGVDYPDNAARFSLFARAVTTWAVESEPPPDIVHGNDWQSALAAVMIKLLPAGAIPAGKCRTVLTVHNLGYQGLFEPDAWSSLDLPPDLFGPQALEFYGRVNFLKGGLLYADLLTTVSERYAREVQTPELGMGLDGVLRARAEALRGITNGIDGSWTPRSDPYLPEPFDRDRPFGGDGHSGKLAARRALRDRLRLPGDRPGPLVVMIGRLVDAKGLDIVTEALDALMERPLQLAVLGTGLSHYESYLREAQKRHAGKLAIEPDVSEPMRHLALGGADALLMPSHYEPCGEHQMMSVAYGTLPIVRATGGLDDTVIDVTSDPSSGYGFKFQEHDAGSLLSAIDRAVALHRQPDVWLALMRRAMALDFSWDRAAGRYERAYREALGER
ncbi:MAG: glycogen/starch synthase, partial [Acidobacteriota bacterium]